MGRAALALREADNCPPAVGSQSAERRRDEQRPPGTSLADILRLLGAGATGPIVMELGDGPLRTSRLTELIPGYTPRTVYRYASKLAELGVVERHREPGVPSKVTHKLTDPCGRDLHRLLVRIADAFFTRLPNGAVGAEDWRTFGLLADLWESGMVDRMAHSACSPTELARGGHKWSFHQINRRAGLLRRRGLLSTTPDSGRRTLYALTDGSRQGMAMVAGVGRWRDRYVALEERERLTTQDMGTIVRAALPLVQVPQHRRKRLSLQVSGGLSIDDSDREILVAQVQAEGCIHSSASPDTPTDGWAKAEIQSWLEICLDGRLDQVRRGGDIGLIDDCLRQLHSALWGRA